LTLYTSPPELTSLLAKFKRVNFNVGVTTGVRSWKGKAKQHFTAYVVAANVLTSGIPDDAESQRIQEWLEGKYQYIDALDTTVPGWKASAVTILGAELKTFAEFHARLWRAALLLFSGSDAGFVSTFARSIDVELTKAWNEGAASIGIEPDEMTDRDMKVLAGIISNENKYILGIANDIQAARENGMEPDQFERQFGNRVNVWSNRYTDVVNQALLYFGKKEKYIWVEGDTIEKCSTCPRLAGIIAFGDEWSRVGFHPQRPPNDKLECGGWNCHCRLEPTTKRRTTNALKKLRAIAGK
jgi:hypothetical protein